MHFGYPVLIDNKVIKAKHVEIIESNKKLICLKVIISYQYRDSESDIESIVKISLEMKYKKYMKKKWKATRSLRVIKIRIRHCTKNKMSDVYRHEKDNPLKDPVQL